MKTLGLNTLNRFVLQENSLGGLNCKRVTSSGWAASGLTGLLALFLWVTQSDLPWAGGYGSYLTGLLALYLWVTQ